MKQRILGNYGHLSNLSSGQMAAALAQRGASRIILSHLSRENNTPELAQQAVALALEAEGHLPGRDLELSVAPKDEPGPRFVI